MPRFSFHDQMLPLDVTDAEAYDYEDGMTTAAADMLAEDDLVDDYFTPLYDED